MIQVSGFRTVPVLLSPGSRTFFCLFVNGALKVSSAAYCCIVAVQRIVCAACMEIFFLHVHRYVGFVCRSPYFCCRSLRFVHACVVYVFTV